MTKEIDDVRKWLQGFAESILHAQTLNELDIAANGARTIQAEEMKRIVQQIVNEGKVLDDFPKVAAALRKARGLSLAARAGMVGRIAGKAGPALAILAALASTQQAVAGEGPLAERIKREPMAVKIINQIGYDTMFGEQVEKYLFPAVNRFYQGVGSFFGIEEHPENRTRLERNGVVIDPAKGFGP
jgi:hypothetical protein